MTDPRVMAPGSPPLRYARRPHRPAVAYTGFAVCVLLSLITGAGLPLLGVFAGDSPPRLAVDAALGLVPFCMFGWGAGRCLAQTRPGWAFEVRGSVYLENLSFRPPRRWDLATVTKATVRVWEDESSYAFYLRLKLPGRRMPRGMLVGAIGEKEPPGRPSRADRTRLMLALADALAEHPDPAVTRRAVADLRWLAAASGPDVAARMKRAQRSR